jgi:Tfp pilus assembly protein PilW
MKYRFLGKTTGIRGLTLVEMILYVAICSALLLSLSSFYIFLLSSRIKSQSITEVEQQGLQIVQVVTQSVRNARSLDTPSVGSSGALLSLTTINGLLNPTTFDVDASGTFRIKEGSGPYVPLTNSHVTVSSTTFQNVSSVGSTDRVLHYSFTVTSNNPTTRNEYDYTKTFVGSATIRQ